jgi:hypothetical protein
MILAAVIFFVVPYEIEKYKYNDCKKVGHATMYCVFNIMK